MFEDSFISRPGELFHPGSISAALVSEDVPCWLNHYQVFWPLADVSVQELVFPIAGQAWVLWNLNRKHVWGIRVIFEEPPPVDSVEALVV
jgi:hypothetical protein